MTDAIVVLITASSEEEAAKIARTLVDEQLIACANIVPQVRSIFFWDGATQDAGESLLICKSRHPLMDRLIERVKGIHSYSVPEIIALPVVSGSPSYLTWVRESTGGK
jgi:periplasmic divalent cation tolerance protein